MSKENIGIIGGGSFGSALADIIGNNGHTAWQWFRDPSQVQEFNKSHENKKYLPSFPLSSNIIASSDLQAIASQCRILFLCVPSRNFREVAHELGNWVKGDQILISTTKGIEAHSFLLMSQILKEETCCLKIGVLSGPNLAKEIVAHMPSGTVIASKFREVIETVQQVLSCPYFRVYGNSDVYGVELGGVLKNVYALATGLVTALEMGDNTKGMLITRGLAEMSRFAAKMGSNPLTFLGLAGVGDLVTTCSSNLSRNFRVGFAIGKGQKLEEALNSIGETAEGVNTVKIVKVKAEALGIRLHILEGLYALLFGGKELTEVLQELMNVPQMEDVEFMTLLPNHN